MIPQRSWYTVSSEVVLPKRGGADVQMSFKLGNNIHLMHKAFDWGCRICDEGNHWVYTPNVCIAAIVILTLRFNKEQVGILEHR